MAKSKKELDKDLMFSKIMPALNSNPFCADAASHPPENQPEAESSPRTLSALRDRIFSKSGGFSDVETITTVNVMENLVLKHVDSVIQRFNVCGCDRCRCDICAYALNLLPPKYVAVPPAEIEAAEREIPDKMIMDALIRAALQIRSKPRH